MSSKKNYSVNLKKKDRSSLIQEQKAKSLLQRVKFRSSLGSKMTRKKGTLAHFIWIQKGNSRKFCFFNIRQAYRDKI